jgi:hypothetical protein
VPAALNLLVFREDRQRVCGPELKARLLRQLRALPKPNAPDEIMGLLVRAGELECAVEDSGAALAHPFIGLTDRLAQALLASDSSAEPGVLCSMLTEARVPEVLYVSPPEGFAYYALHPLAFADVLAQIPNLRASVAVIGIRSIGATLSAVTVAAVRARGLKAERITVRPEGHPYNRRMKFAPRQTEFIRQQTALDAAFLVVDEGPGLSGSTLISVAEALVEAGAPREQITLVCAREPAFDSLRADDGPRRAQRFRWIAASSEPRRPAGAEVFIGGGRWRRHLLPEEATWPAAWTNLERLKYLSAGQSEEKRLFKFLGFGHYSERVLTREQRIADAGFGPAPSYESSGFVSYPWINGRPLSPQDLDTEVLERLAAYCAFRMRAFDHDLYDLSTLQQMAEHNARELGLEAPSKLRLEHPVLADGRMQPHEWLRATGGRILKTDSGSHGDDHFFPGAVDIAWDLAGAIVEWNMSSGQAEALLEAYRRSSGDDPGPRIAAFIVAYALFRCAYCRMAADALGTSPEAARLERAAVECQAMLSLGSSRLQLTSSS